jgi:hypothetical protein
MLEQRMQSFAASFGEVPHDARRLQDFEARQHAASWVRRMLGKGVACHYVIGYARDERWWTFCFERSADHPQRPDLEFWFVEAYDSAGRSSSDLYEYSPGTALWSRARMQGGTSAGAQA